MSHHLPVAGSLPVELMVEILLRIPARSLVRLRSVCKSWNALIIHPQFASIHLEHANKHILLVGFSHSYYRKSVSLFRLNNQLNTLYEIIRSIRKRLNFYKNFNFADCFDDMVVAGSYNGIICLSSSHNSLCGFVALWNPAINLWKPIPIPSGQVQSVGLAYDSHTNDYKIIRLVCLDSELQPLPSSRIEIYSANQDSWIVDPCPIPYFTIQPNCSVIVKGVPYWSRGLERVKTHYRPCNYEDQTNVIASIDPHTGVYKEISYPPEIVMNENTTVRPINLMDSLAVLIHSPNSCGDDDHNSNNTMFHVYARDERCAAWIKIYTTATTTLLQQTKNIFITGYFEDAGKTIVVWWDDHHRRNFFYDTKTNHVCHSIGLDDGFQPRWDESYHHVESLVCVNGMVPIQNQDELGRELVSPF